MTQERVEASRPTIETVKLHDRTIDVVRLPDQPIIEIKYTNIESLLNPESESFKVLKESMKRSRSFTLVPENEKEDAIGVGKNHLDANPQLFKTLAKFLDRNSFSPQDIQERIDVGQMIEKMMKKYSEHAGLINSLSTKLSHSVDQLFAQAMKDTPKSENPVVAFGLINTDAVCTLEQESVQEKINNAFVYALEEGKEQGKTESEVTQEIEHFAKDNGIDISGNVENTAQLIGYVLRSFNEPGGKPQFTNKKLLDTAIKLFEPQAYTLGGAASKMTDLLDGDGENVALITPYQSEEQSNLYTNNPLSIKFTEDGYSFGRVKDKKDESNIPEKLNLAIDHQKGIEVKFNGTTYVAKKADRTIAKSPGYYDNEGNLFKPEPIFNCSDETLFELASHTPLFILNNLHDIESYPPEKYKDTMSTLTRQLRIIRSAGAKTAIEISSTKIVYLKDLAGLIDYVSCNGKELATINQKLAEQNPNIEVLPFDDSHQDSFSLFKNASVLLKMQKAETVNVHETWTDVSAMHASSKEEVSKKTRASLHSKLKVYAFLVGLTPQDVVNGGKLSPSLSVEGKLEVMESAIQYAKSLNLSLKEEAKVIYEIFTTLGHYNPNGISFSLAVSKALNGAKKTSPTGAGDRTMASAANERYKDSNGNLPSTGRTSDLNLIA